MSRLNRIVELPKQERVVSDNLPPWMIERIPLVKKGWELGIQGMQWMTEMDLKDVIEKELQERRK
uniref:Uncharacterized protein n=1 Tax=viral metagenome TaxID=1070528 RepID=A0A6M3IIR4_9ZZZZ